MLITQEAPLNCTRSLYSYFTKTFLFQDNLPSFSNKNSNTWFFIRGAAIKLRDRLGRTPFNVAVDSGNEACAQFLHQVCGIVSTSFAEPPRVSGQRRPHSLVLTIRNAASGNEVEGCQKNPCWNGGTCKDLGDEKYECQCTDTYIGDHCELGLYFSEFILIQSAIKPYSRIVCRYCIGINLISF